MKIPGNYGCRDFPFLVGAMAFPFGEGGSPLGETEEGSTHSPDCTAPRRGVPPSPVTACAVPPSPKGRALGCGGFFDIYCRGGSLTLPKGKFPLDGETFFNCRSGYSENPPIEVGFSAGRVSDPPLHWGCGVLPSPSRLCRDTSPMGGGKAHFGSHTVGAGF